MKIGLILLAAGLSRRFGSKNKLLHPVHGKPLYLHALERLDTLQSGDISLVVVTNTPEIGTECQSRGITVVPSPRAAEGISHSIRAGLQALPEVDAAVFFVADQPELRLQTIRHFLHSCEEHQAPLGCLAGPDGFGNPGWFSGEFFPALEALEGDRGGRRILNAHPELVWTVQAEPAELADLDERL